MSANNSAVPDANRTIRQQSEEALTRERGLATEDSRPGSPATQPPHDATAEHHHGIGGVGVSPDDDRATRQPVLDILAKAIRQEYATADAEGREKPGRPALIKKLANPPEISGHQVRKAKELVDARDASPPEQDASEAPADTGDPEPQAFKDAVNPAQDDAEEPPATPAASQPPPGRQAAKLWPLLLIGLAPSVIIWGGWVDLGRLTGFGPVRLLPGIWDEAVLNTAVALPVSVEAYAAYAFRIWLAGSHGTRTTTFAKWSALGSLVVGGLAQITYHLLIAAGFERAPWWVTTLVACIPVGVFGLAAALAHMARHEHQAGHQR